MRPSGDLRNVAFDPRAGVFGVGAAANAAASSGSVAAPPVADRPCPFVFRPAAMFDAAAREEGAENALGFAAGHGPFVDLYVEGLPVDLNLCAAVRLLGEC